MTDPAAVLVHLVRVASPAESWWANGIRSACGRPGFVYARRLDKVTCPDCLGVDSVLDDLPGALRLQAMQLTDLLGEPT